MNIPKHIAGIVLFIFIVSISVFIVDIVNVPLEMIPPFSVEEGPVFCEIKEAEPPVGYKVQLVSLDFINRESYTTLTLKRDETRLAPERVWVATSFYTLERPLQSWSSAPVEIRLPFDGGDKVTLTLKSACPWCGDASAPRAGYYARVQVSAESSDDARDDRTDTRNKQTPISVLVQAEQKPRR
jgi:hypothetical protein